MTDEVDDAMNAFRERLRVRAAELRKSNPQLSEDEVLLRLAASATEEDLRAIESMLRRRISLFR